MLKICLNYLGRQILLRRRTKGIYGESTMVFIITGFSALIPT